MTWTRAAVSVPTLTWPVIGVPADRAVGNREESGESEAFLEYSHARPHGGEGIIRLE